MSKEFEPAFRFVSAVLFVIAGACASAVIGILAMVWWVI